MTYLRWPAHKRKNKKKSQLKIEPKALQTSALKIIDYDNTKEENKEENVIANKISTFTHEDFVKYNEGDFSNHDIVANLYLPHQW